MDTTATPTNHPNHPPSFYIMRGAMLPSGAWAKHAGRFDNFADAWDVFKSSGWGADPVGIVSNRSITLHRSALQTDGSWERATLSTRMVGDDRTPCHWFDNVELDAFRNA